MITQNIINMLVKFSSKDTATLCKGLNKLVNYNTSIPLSRFSDIPQYMRQKATQIMAELKQDGMTKLEIDTLKILLTATKEFGGLFYDVALFQKIQNLMYQCEYNQCKPNFKTREGEDIIFIP